MHDFEYSYGSMMLFSKKVSAQILPPHGWEHLVTACQRRVDVRLGLARMIKALFDSDIFSIITTRLSARAPSVNTLMVI